MQKFWAILLFSLIVLNCAKPLDYETGRSALIRVIELGKAQGIDLCYKQLTNTDNLDYVADEMNISKRRLMKFIEFDNNKYFTEILDECMRGTIEKSSSHSPKGQF